ncbi:MAG: hypothetical protein QXF48_01970 [Candidatus Anstonellaceae archaeon]
MLDRISSRTSWYYELRKDRQLDVFTRIKPKIDEKLIKQYEYFPINLAKIMYLTKNELRAINYLIDYWEIKRDIKALRFAALLTFLYCVKTKKREELELINEIRRELEEQLQMIKGGFREKILFLIYDSVKYKRNIVDLQEQIVKINPTDIYAKYLKGEIYFQSQLLELAKETFFEAQKIFEKKYPLYLRHLKKEIIKMHWTADLTIKEAIEMIKNYIQIKKELENCGFCFSKPYFLEALDLAVIYFKIGKYKKALKYAIYAYKHSKKGKNKDLEVQNNAFLIILWIILKSKFPKRSLVYERLYDIISDYENILEKHGSTNILLNFLSQLILAKASCLKVKENEEKLDENSIKMLRFYQNEIENYINKAFEYYPFPQFFYMDLEYTVHSNYKILEIIKIQQDLSSKNVASEFS